MMTLQISPFHRRFLIGFAATLLNIVLQAQAPGSEPSKVDFTTAVGISGDLPTVSVGIRKQISPRSLLQLEASSPTWRRDESRNRAFEGGKITDLSLNSGLTGSAMIKAYARPGCSGFYGGIGLSVQTYVVKADSKFERPAEPQPNVTATTGLGVLLNLLTGGYSTRYDAFTETTEGAAVGVLGELGYTFAFSNGQRLELGGLLTVRNRGSATFGVATPSSVKRVQIGDFLGQNSFSVQARYVVPLWR